ncbi:MAG TPA: MBL fold metallo-hydrolase [Xanthobacteraceae bacterium]|nr:MBL fold metallo-hydrolase [Xanthobacteraceae bacterium]
MRIHFIGCGDAFGSGGRFNTCFHVAGKDANFLIDCGASSLVALKQANVDRNAVDLILVTHFHADHFGGVPFFVLDAQFFAKRARPLVIAGPAGLHEWYVRAMETAFPGSSKVKQRFELALVELPPNKTWRGPGVEVTSALVRHGQPEGPFHAYRVTVGGKIIAYSGDTEWTDSLIEIGRDADLFIAEAYFYEKEAPLHLSYKTLAGKLPLIRPKRLVLTHMNEDMLARADEIAHEKAADGLVIEL